MLPSFPTTLSKRDGSINWRLLSHSPCTFPRQVQSEERKRGSSLHMGVVKMTPRGGGSWAPTLSTTVTPADLAPVGEQQSGGNRQRKMYFYARKWLQFTEQIVQGIYTYISWNTIIFNSTIFFFKVQILFALTKPNPPPPQLLWTKPSPPYLSSGTPTSSGSI